MSELEMRSILEEIHLKGVITHDIGKRIDAIVGDKRFLTDDEIDEVSLRLAHIGPKAFKTVIRECIAKYIEKSQNA